MSPILMDIVADTSVAFTTTVVIAGISIVVGVLLLLILVFRIFGIIAPKINASMIAREQKKAEKKAKKQAENKPAAPAPKAAAKPAAAPAASTAPAPAVEQGISGEIVAAISAAIAATEGSGAVIRSIKKKNVRGRNPWANAANIENTRPF